MGEGVPKYTTNSITVKNSLNSMQKAKYNMCLRFYFIFKMTFLIHEWQMSSVAKNQRLNIKLKICKSQYQNGNFFDKKKR